METWPFPVPRNSVAFTSTHITEDRLPILLVTHDDDGAWQFHSGGTLTEVRPKVLCLEHVYSLDPSIGELADLPCGWQAEREAVGQPWIRSALPIERDENEH